MRYTFYESSIASVCMPFISPSSLVGAPVTQNIRTTLVAGLFVSCTLITIMSMVSLRELDSLNEKVEQLVEASEVKTSLIYDMRIAARERNLRLMMTLLVEDEFMIDEEWMQFREQGGLFLSAREQYKALDLSDEERLLLAEQRDISVQTVSLQYKLLEYAQNGDKKNALLTIREVLSFQNKVFEILDRMLDIQKSKNSQIVESARKSQSAASNTVVVLGIAVIVLIIISTVYIIRRISQQTQLVLDEGLKFKALIEGSMDAVLVIENSRVVDANRNALQMFSVENLRSLNEIGEHFLLRFRMPVEEEAEGSIQEAVEHALVDVKRRYHWYFSDFDDQEIPVDVEITAIDLEGRHLVQMVIRDVAEREIFQSALKEINENLEVKVNERTEELNELNSKIAGIARSAGMAEVASGVLHNVGNVLNSINVSTSVLKEQIKNCKAKNIEKISELLAEHRDNICEFFENNEKGKFVIPYMEKLSVQLKDERDNQIKELECLSDNVEHIKTIISMQQAYAGGMGMIENIRASLLFEDAVKINIASINNNRINLEYAYEVDPEINIDKHKMVQVLVNFISNAKYAVMNNEIDNRHIKIGICESEGMLEFYVQDNGIGIEPEHIDRIFEFGFKKRVGGHGYGLHHSALMAKELNGKIAVKSDGKNQGAKFSLLVPKK